MPTTNKRVLINGCSCLVSRELLQYTRFLTLIKITYGILIVLAVMTLVILTINLGERLIPSVQTVPTLVVLIILGVYLFLILLPALSLVIYSFNPRCIYVPHSASCFIVGNLIV